MQLPAAPACVKARLGFLGVSIAKKSFLALYPLPKKLLAVRRDWLEIFGFWIRLFAKEFGALLLLLF